MNEPMKAARHSRRKSFVYLGKEKVDRRTFLTAAGKGIVAGKLIAGNWSEALTAVQVKNADASTRARHHKLFDSDWKFYRGDAANGERPDLDDSRWKLLDLPHDWSIEGPFKEENPSGPDGAYLPGGIGWYRKQFVLSKELTDKHFEILFDGVYMNSDVWLNGHHLGNRPYGYVSFQYDLSPYLHFGKQVNVIAVRVDNSQQPNSRWYSGSGIYRHVWLIQTEMAHVDAWGSCITTPEITAASALVHMKIRIQNKDRAHRDLRVLYSIRDAQGKTIAQQENHHGISAGSALIAEQEFQVENPHLWSPDQPYLYTAVIELYKQNSLLDQYIVPFGIRSFSFDADKGFSLNGKNLKLKGVCIHHDLGCLGAAFHEDAMERRLHLLKEMGCNAIRMSHNPPAPQLLDMCDRMGFLVIDEAFDEWRVGKQAITYGYHQYFDQWAAIDLKSMIERDRNHPSVILWSIGNEIPDKGKQSGIDAAKMLIQVVRETDPTRPVTCAMNNIRDANRSGFADLFDVAGYNGGGGSTFEYDNDHKRYPNRKIYGSEAPHTAQTRGVYLSDENYCSSYDDCFIRMSSEGSWKLVEERPFVAGEFRWTGIDYLGEPIPHSRFHIPSREKFWPARSGDFGVIDTCGFPKDTYYFYQSQWTETPMLHILPHWNWAGMEGKGIFVWCYTNCDSVELFLNGRSLGAQHRMTTAGYHLNWQVPYQPGVLKAVGQRNGLTVCEQEVHTAGDPAKILLTSDKNRLSADRHSLAHVSIRIVDAEDHFVPLANNRIHFQIEGPGRIAGVDNGDPLSHDSFQGEEMNAFHGLCLAIVQAGKQPGQISLKASSPGLISSTITFSSE